MTNDPAAWWRSVKAGQLTFTILLFSCAIPLSARAAATLSGTVLDAGDGTTPVYPVDIDLMDPATGAIVDGFSTTNASDGSYEIGGIAAGEYKVFFNAVGSAEKYLDVLYDGVECDNGGCDRATLGDTVLIEDGANTLDIQLSLADTVSSVWLSGQVRTWIGEPVSSATVEVFDTAGGSVTAALPAVDGSWSVAVPQDATYFLLLNAGRSGFRHQVWNSLPCDGCDPVLAGDPIAVGDEDLTGFDFYLSLKPSDVIFRSSLEASETGLYLDPPCCGRLAYTPGAQVLLSPNVRYNGGGRLSYNLLSGPAGLEVNPGTGVLSWQPGEGDAGADFEVTMEVSDGTATSAVTFAIAVLQGEPQVTTVSGQTTTVAGGALDGLQIRLPSVEAKSAEGAGTEAAETGVGVFLLEDPPSIVLPPRVMRLSEFFRTEGVRTDAPMRITLPPVALPPGRHPSEIQLFVYTGSSPHFNSPAWVPSNLNLSFDDGQVAVDLHAIGELMFVGIYPASSGPAVVQRSQRALSASSVLASINCEANTWYDPSGEPEPRPNFTACTFSDPDSPMLVQIESVDSDHFWTAAVTPENMTAWLVAARATASALQLPISEEETIKVAALSRLEVFDDGDNPASLYGAVTPVDQYSTIYVNAWYQGYAQALSESLAKATLTHEYFHRRQAARGRQGQAEGSLALVDQLRWKVPYKWITEATANWFIDEVFDAEDPIYDFHSTIPPVLQLGLNSGAYDPYTNWPLFKLLSRRCAGFRPGDLFAPILLEWPNPGLLDPVMEHFLVTAANWDCTFRGSLIQTPADAIATMFLDYQLASLRGELDGLLQDSLGDFGESAPINFEGPNDFDEFYYDVRDGIGSAADVVENLPLLTFAETGRDIVDLPRNSAASFLVQGIPGDQVAGRQINLVLRQEDSSPGVNRTLKVHISSTSEVPEFAPFSLFVPEGKEVFIPYTFAGSRMPDLFVTVINEPRLGINNDTTPRTVRVGMETVNTDDYIRAHMVGTWEVVNDAVYRSDGPYADNDNSACHYLQASNVYFENYFYPDGITVNVYAASPVYKKAKVTLNEDGSALWRWYNIDPDNVNYEERYCPVLLDPPERWDSGVRWSVINGRVTIGGVKGHLTVDRLKESYGLDDWDFATGTQDVTDRWRLWRVNE